MTRSPILLVLLAGLLFTAFGCSKSPADKAAQEMLDIAKEMKDIKADGNPAKAMEMFGRVMAAAQKLEEETAKMSDAEKKAFEAKWKPKFDALKEDGPAGFPGF